MKSALSKEKFVAKIEKSSGLIEDFQGCGINTLMNFLDTVSPGHKIAIEALKKLFDYNEDGISTQKHKFNKFNVLLKENKIPYKIYRRPFAGHQELFKYMALPVPVIFDIRVIKFIKDCLKNSGRTFNFGDENDLFNSRNRHILLFVGFSDFGRVLYFVDPVYQLPYYNQKDLSNRNKLCELNTRDFYECTKNIKEFIHFKRVKN